MFIKIPFLTLEQQKIPYRIKLAIFATLIIGIFTHLFVMTNDLPNWDTVRQYGKPDDVLASGRWFLEFASSLNHNLNAPMTSGLLAILFIAFTSAIIVSVLDVKSNISILCISGILVTFPTVTSTMSYMYTADPYMLALLLSVCAVKLAKDYKYGYLYGGLCLAFSIGIYQAYLFFAIILCIFYFIIKAIDNEITNIEWLVIIGKQLLMGIIGVILYVVFLFICLKVNNTELVSYQGINSIGVISFKELVVRLNDSWNNFDFVLLKTILGQPHPALRITIYTSYLITAISFIIIFLKNKIYKNKCKSILLVLFIGSVPFVLNGVLFLSTESWMHTLMLMPYCLIFVLAIVLAERLTEKKYLKLEITKEIVRFVCGIIFLVIIINYSFVANTSYTNMHQRYEKTYGMMLRIVDRIEQLENYSSELPVLFKLDEKYFTAEPSTEFIDTQYMIGIGGETITRIDIEVIAFMNIYLNKTFVSPTLEKREEIKKTKDFYEMPLWPLNGSVKIIENVVVVNIS